MAYDISLAEASVKTQQFQSIYSGNTKALSFPKNELLELLAQPNCTGVRIYFGLNDPARPKDLTVVIVGVRDNGSGDFLQAVDLAAPGNKIKNSGNPCPPNCTVPSNDLSH
jgi:hypothetical protein